MLPDASAGKVISTRPLVSATVTMGSWLTDHVDPAEELSLKSSENTGDACAGRAVTTPQRESGRRESPPCVSIADAARLELSEWSVLASPSDLLVVLSRRGPHPHGNGDLRG